MQSENSNEDVILLDITNVIVDTVTDTVTDTSNVIVGLEIISFVDLLNKILKTEIKNNTSINLTSENSKIILKLLEMSPEYFNELEISFIQIVKDNKIDTTDIPNIIILIQKLYELIYTIKGIKLNGKKRCEVCSFTLKFLIHTLVEEKKIKINDEDKIIFLSRTDALIDSFIGLVRLPKDLKSNNCINSIFGKK